MMDFLINKLVINLRSIFDKKKHSRIVVYREYSIWKNIGESTMKYSGTPLKGHP